jgi:hypothetical protein
MSLISIITGVLPVTRKEFNKLATAFEDLKTAIAEEKAQATAKLQELADKIAALEGQVLTADQVTELVSDVHGVIPDEA